VSQPKYYNNQLC